MIIIEKTGDKDNAQGISCIDLRRIFRPTGNDLSGDIWMGRNENFEFSKEAFIIENESTK